ALAQGAIPHPIATIADLGCGTGRSGRLLARETKAQILCVDMLPTLITAVRGRAAQAGLDHRITAVVGDMLSPPIPAGTMDLIWCESAIYAVGVPAALKAWAPLLADGGCVAFSEAVKRVESLDPAVEDFFAADGVTLHHTDVLLASVREARWQVVGHFPLPLEAWSQHYYEPLAARLPDFLSAHRNNPAARALVDALTAEIDLHDRFGETYGYHFVVCKVGER
ncbi:MAG: class I SAM-dependent methyltransferase, partial [Rhodospirillaceae bacterium]